LLPLGAAYDYETTRTFARLLAVMGVEAEPAISTIVRPIKGRGGKVYIDWGQNGHGQTIVAPFSVRPLPGAPVSCPLRWEEVTAAGRSRPTTRKAWRAWRPMDAAFPDVIRASTERWPWARARRISSARIRRPSPAPRRPRST